MNKQFMTPMTTAVIGPGRVPFNIYCPDHRGRLVLFCRGGTDISEKLLATLRQSDRVFFIAGYELEAFLDYAFEKLESIVGNERIRALDKTEIVFRIGQRLVRRMLEGPDDALILRDSARFVGAQTDLLLSSPNITGHLFSLTAVDSYYYSHGLNVCTFSLLIGIHLFRNARERLVELGLAGMLHDLGKSRISPDILFKPGKLTDAEMRLMRMHATYSYEMLQKHGMAPAVLAAGRSHHERIDGRGYPDGLVGDKIHPVARIVAVADVYDAITSNRVYREEQSLATALTEMARDEGHFDPAPLNALLEVVLRNEKLITSFRSKFPASFGVGAKLAKYRRDA